MCNYTQAKEEALRQIKILPGKAVYIYFDRNKKKFIVEDERIEGNVIFIEEVL